MHKYAAGFTRINRNMPMTKNAMRKNAAYGGKLTWIAYPRITRSEIYHALRRRTRLCLASRRFDYTERLTWICMPPALAKAFSFFPHYWDVRNLRDFYLDEWVRWCSRVPFCFVSRYTYLPLTNNSLLILSYYNIIKGIKSGKIWRCWLEIRN